MPPRLSLPAVIAALAMAPGAQLPPVPKSAAEAKKMGDRSGKLKPGDMAPDFTLKALHKDARVTLSGFRNRRPVALVFGSYT